MEIERFGDAGSFYAEAGMVYDAGAAYVAAGDSGKALENFVRVPVEDKRYRAAANEVARLAAQLSHLDVRMDNFLARFIAEGPKEAKELESFYKLGQVFERHDLLENAKEVLRKIAAARPGYRDTTEWLERLEEKTRVTSSQYERLLKEDEPARRPSSEPPPLPDLPPLPKPRDIQAVPTTPSPLSTTPMRPTAQVSATPQPNVLARDVSEDVERIARELNPSPRGAQATGNTLLAVGVKPDTGNLELQALTPGTILADRYRLEQQIGQGGSGVVFRATDLELSEEVALKVFRLANEDEQALARFRQELQLSRRLVHPNIARLFEFGVYRGCRFITMELLLGCDLKRLLTGPMEVGRGIYLLTQVCCGLKAAHDLGIVHRDIKPENLFVIRNDGVKVMDFGIAKRQLTKGVTMAGMVAGTPEYISPEQIDNFAAVTPVSDLYSLGVVAYEMFTGELPFRSNELVPLLMMHINNQPPPLRSKVPSIPEPLERLVLRLLAKKPEQRFPDAGAVAAALEEIRRHV
jgi:serine/threonine-protein kinase